MPCGAVSVIFLTYMDIDLLAKMVGELILDNDEVSLPGVGTFVAEVMPSSFSDKGYTINPPYRKLSFRQREKSDGLLAALYARANGVDVQTASSILEKFLAELRETLKVRKTVIFPGLGRLRATRENNFFFIPDEDHSLGDIFLVVDNLFGRTYLPFKNIKLDFLDAFIKFSMALLVLLAAATPTKFISLHKMHNLL